MCKRHRGERKKLFKVTNVYVKAEEESGSVILFCIEEYIKLKVILNMKPRGCLQYRKEKKKRSFLLPPCPPPKKLRSYSRGKRAPEPEPERSNDSAEAPEMSRRTIGERTG